MVLLFRPMPGEHPWTPVSVPFEIHTQYPSLEALEPQPVIDLLKRLMDRQEKQGHSSPVAPTHVI